MIRFSIQQQHDFLVQNRIRLTALPGRLHSLPTHNRRILQTLLSASNEIMDEAECQHNRDLPSKNKNLRRIPPPPGPVSDIASELDFKGLDTSNLDLFREGLLKSMSSIEPPPHPPLESLPCANIEVTKYKVCLKPGTKACSACKLVSYCSPVSDHYLLAPSPLMLQ